MSIYSASFGLELMVVLKYLSNRLSLNATTLFFDILCNYIYLASHLKGHAMGLAFLILLQKPSSRPLQVLIQSNQEAY